MTGPLSKLGALYVFLALWIVFPTEGIDSHGAFYIFPISAFDQGHRFLKHTGEDSLILVILSPTHIRGVGKGNISYKS